jgi:allophanate hydrolase subunit 1
MAQTASQITLRALEGEPLADARIRDMVVATAHAIAERQAVQVLAIHHSASSITVTLDVGRIEAIGFAAELRRLTTRWYTQKYGVTTLWGEPLRGDNDADDAGEEWKQA